MLTIKRISDCEFYDLITYEKVSISFKKQHSINNKECFAVIDGNKILGHAFVVMFPEILIAHIIEIYVLPQERNQGLGDALLRSVLHYLRINLFTSVIIKGHSELNDFLINKDIEEIDLKNMEENIKTVLQEDGVYKQYICNIEKFLKRKCRGNHVEFN